jgi:hypothetical protein
MSSQLPSKNPTAYVGVYPLNPGNIVFRNRDPNNLLDTNNYNPGDTWMNPDNNHIFMLMRDFNLSGGGKQAVWVSITGGGGGGGIQNLQGDYGAVIAPSAGLCTIFGTQATRGIFTTGSLPNHLTISCDYSTAGIAGVAHTGVCSFNSANFTVVGGFVSAIGGGIGTMVTLSGNDAVAISPDGAGNTKILGQLTQGIITVGVPGNNEIQIQAENATAAANVGLTQKGVCSFNSANFTVVNGFVSAIASAAGLQTLTTDDGHVVGPTAGGNITVNGTALQGISTTGNILGNEIAVTAANATSAANVGLAQRGVCCFDSANFTSVNGFVSANPRSGFSASSKAAAAVTGNGTGYTIVYNAPDFNVGGGFDGVSSFVAPTSGIYIFGCTLSAGSFSSVQNQMDFAIENTTTGKNYIIDTNNPYNEQSTSGFYKITGSTLTSVTAGDVIQTGFTVSGGAKTVGVNTGGWFWGYQIA